jgi:MFS transporter, DHA2 family, multidrug resistance protein
VEVRDVLVAGGLALSAAGLGMLTQADASSGLAILVIGSVVLTLGVAPVGTLATDVIVGSAPPERAGAASGVSETGAEFGGALGIAVLGSIGTAVYRSEVAGAFPDEVPPDAAEAARDTLGGAVVAADELPDQLGIGLLDTAREAFTMGLQLTAITSAAIVLGMAILAVVLLRNVCTSSELEDQPDTGPIGAVASSAGIEEAPDPPPRHRGSCESRKEESPHEEGKTN